MGIGGDGQGAGMEAAGRSGADLSAGMAVDAGQGAARCPVAGGVGNVAGEGAGLGTTDIGDAVFYQTVFVAGMGAISRIKAMAIRTVTGNVEVVVDMLQMLGGTRRISRQISFELGGGMAVGAGEGCRGGPVAPVNNGMTVVGTGTGAGIPGCNLVDHRLESIIVRRETVDC